MKFCKLYESQIDVIDNCSVCAHSNSYSEARNKVGCDFLGEIKE